MVELFLRHKKKILFGTFFLIVGGSYLGSQKTSEEKSFSSLPKSWFKNPLTVRAIADTPTVTPKTTSPQNQIELFDELIKLGNDNDPRWDTQLKVLTEASKDSLRKKYESSPKEDRNLRGTIVFLLGRNLRNADDVTFLSKVIAEKPCLGLKDCSVAEPTQGEEHEASGLSVTLAYPQLNSVEALGKFLKTGSRNDPLYKEVRRAVEKAKGSPTAEVREKAEKILKRW